MPAQSASCALEPAETGNHSGQAITVSVSQTTRHSSENTQQTSAGNQENKTDGGAEKWQQVDVFWHVIIWGQNVGESKRLRKLLN